MPDIDIERLKELAASPNIAEHLPDEDLDSIGRVVVDNYELDDGNHEQKRTEYQEFEDLAMQIVEEKSFPWPGASNMKFPSITGACIQFSARVFPEIVQTGQVARVKVQGADPEGTKQDRALRVESHLNFQLTEDIAEWENESDILLSLLPLYGCYYKKIWFDPIENKPVVKIRNPKNIVTSKSSSVLANEERISDPFKLSRNKIIERIRSGIYLNVDLPGGSGDADTDDVNETDEEDLIEQHCWFDLDGDDYKEPYVITVHKETKTVFRIVARFTEEDIHTIKIEGKEVIRKIDAFCHFVRYLFMQSFKAATDGYGFGDLLIALVYQINDTINQLTDAGTLANLAANSGFVSKGIRMEGGPFRITHGEWMPVEARGAALKDNIFPLPAVEPSQTLFALLGFLVEISDRLSSSNQVAPGEIPANTPATTILAVIEEGQKVYSRIYKRVFNSLKEELRKIYYLNKMYGDPEDYAEFQDDPDAELHKDYNFRDRDIAPVAAPEVSSDMQRLVRANGLVDLAETGTGQAGGLDARVVVRNYLEATHQTNIEELQPPPPAQQPPSIDETMIEIQAELAAAKLEQDQEELRIKAVSEFVKSMKTLAEAEAIEPGEQLRQYGAAVQAISQLLGLEQQKRALEQPPAQAQAPALPAPGPTPAAA